MSRSCEPLAINHQSRSLSAWEVPWSLLIKIPPNRVTCCTRPTVRSIKPSEKAGTKAASWWPTECGNKTPPELGGWSQSPHRLRLKGPFVENLVQVFHRDLLDAFNFILDRHPIVVRQPPATDA